MNRNELPDDPELLKDLLLSMADEKEYWKKIASFLRMLLVARRTEKKMALQDPPEQLRLFDEAEVRVDEDAEKGEEEEEKISAVQPEERKRGHKKPLPEVLPRKEIVIDIPDDQKICACGTAMKVIRREISEKLCIIPRQVYVERIVRPIYACPNCEGTETEGNPVKIAPMPPQLIPQGIATPELVSTVIIDKFCDSLPLYRQSNIYRRIGVELSEATLSRWVITAADKCKPLLNLLLADMFSGNAIHMDETRVQVLKEPERADHLQSVMWVMCGGKEKHRVRFFHYNRSHGGAVAAELLKDFNGFLMTDGLKAYESVGLREGLIHVSCLVHMRRRFAAVAKMGGKHRQKGICDRFLNLVADLYKSEKKLRTLLDNGMLSRDDFIAARKNEHIPILDKLKQLLDENISRASPTSAIGDALSYALRHWERMIRYLDCAELPPDNNEAENAIRPFAVGRKNWLFAGSPRGADASALFYTLIESAKANDIDPQQYLSHVLKNIVIADTTEKLEALLPWNFK